jgi:hypothetical protein
MGVVTNGDIQVIHNFGSFLKPKNEKSQTFARFVFLTPKRAKITHYIQGTIPIIITIMRTLTIIITDITENKSCVFDISRLSL